VASSRNVASSLRAQIFGKGAKFSMFKPAEEMVYIGLDEESRTKGKAAIDVVGAQSGKSLGSVLQQALLLATGGALAGAQPRHVYCQLLSKFDAVAEPRALY
jgi:ATP/ADP translocase